MNHPTDPMTPVRALLELSTSVSEQLNDGDGAYPVEYHDVANAAADATASISQLLSEHDRVVALITELHKLETPGHNDYIDVSAEKSAYEWCADRLAAILEGK